MSRPALTLALAGLLCGCPGPAAAPSADPPPAGEPAVPGFEDPPLEATPAPDPTRRPLAAILRDVEAVAARGPDFEDPLGELERLQRRPQRLLEEATAPGARALPELCASLIGMQRDPDALGYRERRAFVCLALGRLAQQDPAAVFEALLAVAPRDQRRVAQAARDVAGGPRVLSDWLAAAERDGHDALATVLREVAR
ncbi:MAG: hypothetical protein KDD82_01175 [Planctomycetes bacterium]|nr:hypothetical protein [Planctomycetota bacterium]